MPLRNSVISALLVIAGLSLPAAAQPVTTAFVYQGEVRQAGTPFAGNIDARFRLYDAPTGGIQQGPQLQALNTALSGGRFTTELDFGAVFTGQQRWLEIDLRPAGGPTYTTLAPRQPLDATPHAVRALAAGSADSATSALQLNGQPASFYLNASNLNSGTLSNALLASTVARTDIPQTFTAAMNFVSGSNSFTGSGAALSNLSASALGSGTVAAGRMSGAYAGITGVGTVTSGSWQSSPIGAAFGGTGLSSAPAAAGQYLRSSGAGVWSIGTIAASDVPALTLGGDLSGTHAAATVARLQGNSISTAAPAAGNVLKWTGAAWAPGVDLDTNTTYAAGSGLQLSGTTFSIPLSGVTGAMVLDGAVASADLASDGASLNKVSGGALTVSGSQVGLGIVPATKFHIADAASIALRAQAAINLNSELQLTENFSGLTGGAVRYNGTIDSLELGTYLTDTYTPALRIPRTSTTILALGDLNVAGDLSLATPPSFPAVTRYYTLGPADLVADEGTAVSRTFAAVSGGRRERSGRVFRFDPRAPRRHHHRDRPLRLRQLDQRRHVHGPAGRADQLLPHDRDHRLQRRRLGKRTAVLQRTARGSRRQRHQPVPDRADVDHHRHPRHDLHPRRAGDLHRHQPGPLIAAPISCPPESRGCA